MHTLRQTAVLLVIASATVGVGCRLKNKSGLADSNSSNVTVSIAIEPGTGNLLITPKFSSITGPMALTNLGPSSKGTVTTNNAIPMPGNANMVSFSTNAIGYQFLFRPVMANTTTIDPKNTTLCVTDANFDHPGTGPCQGSLPDGAKMDDWVKFSGLCVRHNGRMGFTDNQTPQCICGSAIAHKISMDDVRNYQGGIDERAIAWSCDVHTDEMERTYYSEMCETLGGTPDCSIGGQKCTCICGASGGGQPTWADIGIYLSSRPGAPPTEVFTDHTKDLTQAMSKLSCYQDPKRPGVVNPAGVPLPPVGNNNDNGSNGGVPLPPGGQNSNSGVPNPPPNPQNGANGNVPLPPSE